MPEKKVSVIFPEVETAGDRPWGEEKILCVIPKVLSLKQLFIKKGSKGGLQFHQKKNECGVLISGKLLIRYLNDKDELVEKIMHEGDVFHFPTLCIHQEEAIEDCIIIEASTPHFNDRVRVDEIFGLGKSKGLPSTSVEEIITR